MLFFKSTEVGSRVLLTDNYFLFCLLFFFNCDVRKTSQFGIISGFCFFYFCIFLSNNHDWMIYADDYSRSLNMKIIGYFVHTKIMLHNRKLNDFPRFRVIISFK